MLELRPFEPHMLRDLDLQAAQASFGVVTAQDVETVARAGWGCAAYQGERLLGIGGVAKRWEDYGIVWGLLASDLKRDMVALHMIVRRAIESRPEKRLEAQIAQDHMNGHAWINMLGFTLEGVALSYWQGRDFAIYSRIRGA